MRPDAKPLDPGAVLAALDRHGVRAVFASEPVVVTPRVAATPMAYNSWSVGQEGGVLSTGTAQLYGTARQI